ncbi:unnamed protein product [Sphagnum jensenii]|uniref:Secreted protein n=1 Tax=Sphagnum jensenii TaxID=128206 RepID=A0ABP0WPU0_9BRYO
MCWSFHGILFAVLRIFWRKNREMVHVKTYSSSKTAQCSNRDRMRVVDSKMMMGKLQGHFGDCTFYQAAPG